MLQVKTRMYFMLAAILMSVTHAAFAQALSDPTMPPRQLEPRSETKGKGSSALRLQSIQFMGTNRSALISGQWLYQGERFDNYVIEKIDLNYVTLRDQQTDKRLTLRLFELTKDSMNTSGNQL
ncbi:MAG: hypothetical protein GYB30_02050 [Gammaproteobacteria bacterium]|nr:hypothetical protein [Gammaproteobacteria bacterium]